MTLKATFLTLVACFSTLTAEAAQSLPVAPSLSGAAAGSTLLTHVDYRGYRGGYYRGGYRGGYWRGGRWIGLGIGAGIVGSAIIADDYYYRRYRYSGSSAVQRCADTYRSFDPRSGTYMGYDGERHVCPYL